MPEEKLQYDETLTEVTALEIADKLPDPFLKTDGTRVKDIADWEEHKKTLYQSAVELQYGTMPPAPEVLLFEPTDEQDREQSSCSYRITAGTKEKQVTFCMKVIRPAGCKEKCPVIVDGDLCFNYAFTQEFHKEITDNGMCLALFNRTELAHDIKGEGRGKGALYEVYPEYTFGAIGAWAWGYSRCVDVLTQLEYIDPEWVIFTGHSRGAKTAMLAGVLDDRARIVNPNETCQGACSSYRIYTEIRCEDGEIRRSEKLADLGVNYPFWMGPHLPDYIGLEAELPFDSHFLEALVAPRTLLIGNAASDSWANPLGSWQIAMAAREVYSFLHAEDKLYWYFRRGTHFHDPVDVRMLVSVILHEKNGTPLKDGFFRTPFKPTELFFDWRKPE